MVVHVKLRMEEKRDQDGKKRIDLIIEPKANNWVDVDDVKREKYINDFYDKYSWELDYRMAMEESEMVKEGRVVTFKTKHIRLLDVKENSRLKRCLRLWGE